MVNSVHLSVCLAVKPLAAVEAVMSQQPSFCHDEESQPGGVASAAPHPDRRIARNPQGCCY